eukprot:6086588-Heterocapsa_arctica.AAC.2
MSRRSRRYRVDEINGAILRGAGPCRVEPYKVAPCQSERFKSISNLLCGFCTRTVNNDRVVIMHRSPSVRLVCRNHPTTSGVVDCTEPAEQCDEGHHGRPRDPALSDDTK